MNTREKIILVLLAIVACAGVFIMLTDSESEEETEESSATEERSFDQQVSQVVQEVQMAKSLQGAETIFKALQTQLTSDPFLNTLTPQEVRVKQRRMEKEQKQEQQAETKEDKEKQDREEEESEAPAFSEIARNLRSKLTCTGLIKSGDKRRVILNDRQYGQEDTLSVQGQSLSIQVIEDRSVVLRHEAFEKTFSIEIPEF